MSNISIRQLEPDVKTKLRIRAASHGCSMEEEARNILRAALAEPNGGDSDLGQRVRERFTAIGGVELSIPPRELVREPPRFELAKR